MALRFRTNLWTGELEQVDDGADNGRSLIYKEAVSPHLVQGRAGQTRSISETRPHVSKALGIHPAQAAKFNAELREYGVTDASYDDKTGFLKSTNDEHHAAALAVRGYYDGNAGNVGQKWANAIGF